MISTATPRWRGTSSITAGILWLNLRSIMRFTALPDAVSAYPIGQDFAGDYALEFDMWLNYNGGAGGGSGSTEYSMAGINHLGNKVVWRNNAASDGFWFAVTGEGGATQDYEAVRHALVLSVSAGGFVGNSLNASAGFYQNLFPNPPYETRGSPGKVWTAAAIVQDGFSVEWRLNGVVVATRQDISVTSGNIMLGYQDIFSSIANPASQNFVIYDNVRVTVPPTDCNANGLADACEISIGAALDCNANDRLDVCEVIDMGDFNADAKVDAQDQPGLSACLGGPGATPAPADLACIQACLDAFDADGDGDVDLANYADMLRLVIVP